MQHATLTLERWAAFPRDEQLLMIANEMNRASKLLAPQDESRLTTAYERTLQLTDLTVAARPARGLTRELLAGVTWSRSSMCPLCGNLTGTGRRCAPYCSWFRRRRGRSRICCPTRGSLFSGRPRCWTGVLCLKVGCGNRYERWIPSSSRATVLDRLYFV